MFEEKFFIHRKINAEKLLGYGFSAESGAYRDTVELMDGKMRLLIAAEETSEGAFAIKTKVIDVSTGEEYTLYKLDSAAGAYVGEVRAACEAVLTEIAEKCCDFDLFRRGQTLAVIDHVKKRYGSEPEFLWEKFPKNAVFRRSDNRKWYGAILTVSLGKLGQDSDEIAEILDLRADPAQITEIVDRKRYFPGWHMNKKNWITVILDGSLPNDELFRRIEESYRLAGRARR